MNNCTIALHAHCFYHNSSGYILDLIKKFPLEIDVYISTSKDSIARVFEAELPRYSSVGALKVSVVPNIGRNFGPMLVEFAAELARYELVCHVHTKKSIHSGAEGDEWGKYLIDGIIGNGNIIEKIVTGFMSNPDWGIAYPETHPVVPLWARHWLGNYGIASNWSNKLGISISPGFQNYPTGGMFWSRTSSIWQLLAHKWEYINFPKEMSQLDGTLHHAIERIIGAACNYNAYKQIVYDPNRMIFHENLLTHQDINSYNTIAQNYITSKKPKFVTFDFLSLFKDYESDLYRRSNLMLDRELFEAGKTNHPGEFADLRSKNELDATSDGRWAGSINLNELTAHSAKRLNISDDLFISREIKIISSILIKDINSELYYNLAINAGIAVVLISSLPYDEDALLFLLRNSGLISPRSIICLYDISGRRSDGSMWDCILRVLDCQSNEIVHFGKNVVEDIRNAAFKGIPAYLIT